MGVGDREGLGVSDGSGLGEGAGLGSAVGLVAGSGEVEEVAVGLLVGSASLALTRGVARAAETQMADATAAMVVTRRRLSTASLCVNGGAVAHQTPPSGGLPLRAIPPFRRGQSHDGGGVADDQIAALMPVNRG